MKFRLTFLISAVIVILSVIPIPEVEPLEDIPLFDKWVHFVMYSAVAVAMWADAWIDFRKTGKEPSLFFAVISNTYPAILGGAMELVQAYCTTNRSGDYMDFLADCIGGYLGVLISVTIWKIAKISEAR